MIILPKRIDLIKELPAGTIGAEIGVWRGYFSVEILQKTRVRHLYLVDAWKPQPSYNDPLTDTDHEANLAETKHHLRGMRDRWTIVRGTSLEVGVYNKTIPPLDWVYIDADHSYEACLTDLRTWELRLKPNGVIMGHDYTNNEQAKKWNFGVIEAVTEFCKTNGWKLTRLTDEDFASYRLDRA
jgi:hypothetical protein